MSRLGAIVAAVLLPLLLLGCEPSGDNPQKPSADNRATAPIAGKSITEPAIPLGTGFDFYVLSLSWSPSYCEAEGEDANPQQCKAARPYAFIVHGLWPQFERGYPEDCPTDTPSVPNELVRTLYDLMPAAGLIRHEWRTHGSCSGLSQEQYFGVLRAAREHVRIPDQYHRLDDYLTVRPRDVEAAFLKANASLPANGIAVSCDKRYLSEVRVCMTKDLAFRPCPEIDRRECRLDKAVMPPTRGG